MSENQSRIGRVTRHLLTANWTRWIVVILLITAAFYVGRSGRKPAEEPSAGSEVVGGGSEAATTWTCSMHPQIQLPNPGDCPICGMDLIPLKDSGDDAGPRALAMSESDKALAQIQTAPVERRFVESEVRMVGKVVYDETRVKSLSAWIPGRLDRLFVDYTGTAVSKGDHMVLLYSPELLEAQGSLIEAKKSLAETANERSQFLRDSAKRHLESEREKLRLWGLTEKQISAIEERGKVEPHIQINAPLSGIVIHKNAVEGMYVKTGSPIYTVADLSVVWLELDAYEMDFPWIRYGQTVEIETEAFPGEKFEGWISFVPPYLNETTRTKKVRVNVENADLRLKPGMFVRAVVRSKLAKGGRVMEPDLAGKFICPMHHEIVKDDSGDCDVCGMDLVPATALGFVTAEDPKEAPIVVPASAVLLTGRRGVVYVAVPEKERPTYEGREVVVGPRAGDWYIIREGLSEGEVVVTNGNFKIDSALQILAKPSMMSMSGEKKKLQFETSPEFLSALAPVFESYFQAQVALSKDNLAEAAAALAATGKAANGITITLASADAHSHWMRLAMTIKNATEHAHHATDIASARDLFKKVSDAMLEVEKTFGHGGSAVHRIAFCPMAADGKGAAWLQKAEEVENPYYGASMYRCGEIRSEHPGKAERDRRASPEESEADRRSQAALGEFRRRLSTVYEAYFALHRALASDDLTATKKALESLGRSAEEVAGAPAKEDQWSKIRTVLIEKASHAGHASDLDAARKLFRAIAPRIIDMETTFGHPGGATHRVAFCSMANDGAGGAWLQLAKEVENPFYGASMYRCGEIRSTHEGDGK